MNVKRQGKTLAGAWMKNPYVRAINAYYKSRKNPSRMQKIKRAKQYQKQGFWETVHVIDSQSRVPFGAVSAR
jgi:uncharacterized membrane-anchored protein